MGMEWLTLAQTRPELPTWPVPLHPLAPFVHKLQCQGTEGTQNMTQSSSLASSFPHLTLNS